MAEMPKTLPSTSTLIEICWSSTKIREGFRAIEHRHHRLGIKLSIVLTQKSLRLSLLSHLADNFKASIHGSTMKQSSGL